MVWLPHAPKLLILINPILTLTTATSLVVYNHWTGLVDWTTGLVHIKTYVWDLSNQAFSGGQH